MKKFKFRLARVLQYRETVLEERKRELALKTQLLREAEQNLDQLSQQRQNNVIPQNSSTTVEALILQGAYLERLLVEIEQAKLKIIEATRVVEEAHQAYLLASQEHKALDTLQEKQLAEYQSYIDHEESKIFDELTVQGSTAAGEESL